MPHNPTCNINCCNLLDLLGTGATFQLEIVDSTGDCTTSWEIGFTAVMDENDLNTWDNEGDPLANGSGFYTLSCGANGIITLYAIDCPNNEPGREGTMLLMQCNPIILEYLFTIPGSDLACNCMDNGGTVTIRVTRLT